MLHEFKQLYAEFHFTELVRARVESETRMNFNFHFGGMPHF